ncbi:MAG: type II toxin-antitoxin system Phd/YefM family antitoxin [Patescibacteria group bacterium]
MINIIPITQARSRLGNLAQQAIASNYFVLTKGGNPPVALVDLSYLKNLEETVKKIYQKTFIDPKLNKYTRAFSDQEINEWQKEDQL